MRKWTDKQQAQLDALQTLRTQAVDRLDEDIEVLLRANGYDPERAEHMCDFLRERGQAVLDMLLVHFEPSPQAVKVDDPAHWQSFESAVKRG